MNPPKNSFYCSLLKPWPGLGLCAGLMACSTSGAALDEAKLPPPAAGAIDYRRDIQPILEISCLKCHGPEKPKSGFRIDDRAALLRGGTTGVSVLPGRSGQSPLIHYVAGLVADMEMPPEGKGDKLTPAQIGLLRAWIDQGVAWAAETNAVRSTLSVTPTAGFIEVQGNSARFRQHHGLREGWNGGLESFEYAELLSERTKALVQGRVLNDDIGVTLSLERKDWGFIRGGFSSTRTWDDNTGGYYARFTPSQYALNRDLHVDRTRFWLDSGWTAPFGTQFRVGYEFQGRDGEIALTRWLPAFNGAESKRFLPTSKGIDESLHILKFDLAHEWETLRLANSLRYEFNELDSRHTTVNIYQPDTASLRHIREKTHLENLANAFTAEKVVNNWLMLSGGYLYSHLDGDGSYGSGTVDAAGAPAFGGFWNGEGLLLERDAHVLNLNAQLGLFDGLLITGGAQTEWNHQESFGPINFNETDLNNPPALTNRLAIVHDEIQRFIAGERLGLRYHRIPFTALYAEADWRQEIIDQQNGLAPEGPLTTDAFARNTDLEKTWQRYRAGFDLSPWTRASFNAWAQRFDRHSDFDQDTRSLVLFPPTVLPGMGYPGFLREQSLVTDEIGARVVFRPASWLKTSVNYQMGTTEFENSTKAIAGLTPGGRVDGGDSDTHTVSLNASLTPWSRLYLFGTLSYQWVETMANAHGEPSVAPYRGDVISAAFNGSYVLNEKTDLHLAYNFSISDFAQANATTGLPLGIDYQLHTVRAGVARQLTKNTRARLDYLFSIYDEPYSAGRNDYTAHGIFVTWNYRWP